MMELGDCRFCGSACPWRGNARPTRLSPSGAASGLPVGPRGRSGPSWPIVCFRYHPREPPRPPRCGPLWYCLCHSGPPPLLPLWLLTAWPGGAAWCRAALGRGLAVVWLYERPGLAFPYPLRVHPVRCLPAAWLHSFVATSEPLLVSSHRTPAALPARHTGLARLATGSPLLRAPRKTSRGG